MKNSRSAHVFFASLRRSRSFRRSLFVFGLSAAWLGNAGCSPSEGPGGATGGLGAGGLGAGGLATTGGSTLGAGGSGGSSSASGGVGGGAESGAGGVAQNGSGGQSEAGSGGAAAGGSPGSGGGDAVMLTNSTFEFHHFPIETASSGLWNGPPTPSNQATKTVYDTVILENSYLKVTLLPDYGGRILSIIHKPTGRELLYQNPMGTPYLMGEGIFYYDYLVILGGIFPSFPEPEHGKYWNQPYELQIVSESPEAVTVRMSRQDDLEWVNGVPEPYDAGRTDLLVELDVTLRAGRSSVELATKLTNTRATPLDNFEYWTVTTLAPGSEPGDTKISDNTKIVAKMDQVHLLESSWSWFGAAEERVSGEIFKWNNLSSFENWDDQGTAFAYPSYEANFSGLINQDSDTGILRVTEGEGTEGLKLWTFGMQSLSIDWTDSSEWLRPTIEMWHGVTPEFWDRETMAAGEVRTWRDHYFPTLGMRDVTASSEFGAVHLEGSVAAETYSLHVVATLAVPNQTVHVVLRLGDTVAHEEDVTVPAGSPLELSPGIPSSQVPAGAVYSVEFLLGGTSILTGQIHLP